MEGNFKKWINRINSKQDVLTEDNVGQFMDLELATKSTPTSGDTVLGRDSLTGKAVEIPTSSLGGNGNIDTSNLVPYTGANKDVNIGAYYFETSQGFKKTGGTANQFLMADGNTNTYGTTAGTVAEGNHTHTFTSITSKPTTLSGYGITDGINTSDVVTTATANKILKLDANAKLPTSITGNADGNAATATKLQTARTINGVSFDGSADITINAGTSYTLPIASATVLGGVKIGSGISIDGNGVISANAYTAGTENRLAKFSSSTLTNSIIYDDGASVGIGATTLGARLDVKAQGALSTNIAFRVRNSTDTQNFLVVTGAGEVYNRGAKGNEFNTFFGEYSGINSTGSSNNAFGRSALASNTTGNSNSAFGNNVLQDNTTGDCNNAFGVKSLFLNTTGTGNNAFGYNALESNTIGKDNSAFGGVALGSNTTGNYNTAVGSSALQDNTTGNQNVALGSGAGCNIIGGLQNTTPNNSVFIGFGTTANANNETNQIVIGHSAIGNGSNTATIGNDSTTNVYLKGITNSNGFKTPTGTATQALTANGGVFDLNTKADLVGGKIPASQLPAYVDETKKATITVELISQLTTNFYAPNALRINSTALISGSGTLTLKVNDVAYTLGNLIPQGAKITAETTSSSVYNLISIYE